MVIEPEESYKHANCFYCFVFLMSNGTANTACYNLLEHLAIPATLSTANHCLTQELLPLLCKATSKMRAYQATQRLGKSYNTKTKEYND